MSPAAPDWLAFSRRCEERARAALARFPQIVQRAEQVGRGEGGDMTLAIDKAVEDAVFLELGALGTGARVVSEERGEFDVGDGGHLRLVIDPIDGSLNAKRRLPPYALSIAVADGPTMGDVQFGFVADLAGADAWWASRGGGAFCDGTPLSCGHRRQLEILGVESAHPRTVADNAELLASTGADRLRIVGSIALELCYVASSRFDAMLSLRASRSVDAAAGQLIVTEAGGVVAFPDADGSATSLGLEMRSRVCGAASREILERLLDLTGGA